MARALGEMRVATFSGDADQRERTWITGRHATRGNLAQALAEKTPGLLCPTSHGMTATGDLGRLRDQLGAAVGCSESAFRPLSWP
jgi:hypothetical protein